MLKRILHYQVADKGFPTLEDCYEALEIARKNHCIVRLEYGSLFGYERTSVDVDASYSNGEYLYSCLKR